MSDLSEKEISHLQEYPKPVRAIYARVRELVDERGFRSNVKKDYIAFRRSGRFNLIKMYFRQEYIHFYVLHDNYRYRDTGKVPMRDVEQKKARIASMVQSYEIEEPNEGHKHFYLIVDNADHMDELRAFMQPVLS